MRGRVDELAGQWLQPIGTDTRAGQDARHEPEHEIVRAEIAKLSGVLDVKVDWARVEQVGTQLLTSKAKDLVIATYVACALHEQSGLDGLARGTALLAGLMTDFAADMFPARPRARANALEWFAERSALRLAHATGHSAEDLALLRALSVMLVEAARASLGDEAPSLRPLSTAIERLGLSVTATASSPDVTGARAVADREKAKDAHPLQQPTARADDPSDTTALLVARLHAQAEAWLAPISTASPAGEDTSYADSAARVRTEIQRLESPTGQRPDWKLVFEESESLLRTQTKDLVLATYLTSALWETRRLEGVALGITILRGLVERYWDTMWPAATRPRRRTNALSWLAERLGAALAGAVLTPSDRPMLEALEGESRRLGELLVAQLAADAPPLRPLFDAIARLGASVPEAPAGLEAATPRQHTPQGPLVGSPSPVTSGAGVQAPPLAIPASVPAPQDPADLTAFLRRTGANLVEAAQSMRGADPANPRAYRLLRAGLWLHIDSLPPADAQGRTRVPPPDKRAREALDGFFANARWEAVLDQAEGMAAQSPFWLDAHFFAVQALQGLGDRFTPAATALTGEARGFAERLAGLTQLRFSDGTPMASADTLAWLRRTLPDQPPAIQAAITEASLPEAVRAGLSRGDAQAAKQLNQLIHDAPSLRVGFMLRLELAEVLRDAGRLDQAVATYLGLEQDLDAHGIERWEPDLAIQVLRGLWTTLERSVQAQGVAHPEAPRVCARLARLSPTALL